MWCGTPSSAAHGMAGTCTRSAATRRRRGARASSCRHQDLGVCHRLEYGRRLRRGRGLPVAIGAVECRRRQHAVAAVGAAIIGGTSLFGGHGRVIDAVLGGLVDAVINNGMSDLIQGTSSAGYEYVVTGAVLLLAAGFDAGVRRERAG